MGSMASQQVAEEIASLMAARRRLETIPNVGPATARDLLRLGIRSPEELADLDPDVLYEELCQLDGRRHDPCVRDIFHAVIAFVTDGTARPWWHYTRQRKAAPQRS